MDNQNSQSSQTNESNVYPSAELLLSIVQKEYDSEDERSKILDTRVNIFLPLSVALLAFIASFLNMSDLKNKRVNNVLEALPQTLFRCFNIKKKIQL